MARRPRPGSVRNVVTGRSDGYTGRVPFPRLGGATVAYESLLARDFLVVTAAFEADVTAIRSEPVRLVARLLGEPIHYTPDYEIERIAGRNEFVEVKPIEEVEPDRARFPEADEDDLRVACLEADARFEALAEACERVGRTFRLVTEDEIRVEPMLENAAFTLRGGDDFYPPEALLSGREALARHRPSGVADLQRLLPHLDALALAVRLSLIGALEIDPTRPFDRHSIFSRVDGDGIHDHARRTCSS